MNVLRTKQNNKELTATFGITQYSDLTEAEFLSLHLNNHTALPLKQRMSQQSNDSKVAGDGGTADSSGTDQVSDYEKYNYVYQDKRSLDKALPVKFDWFVSHHNFN